MTDPSSPPGATEVLAALCTLRPPASPLAPGLVRACPTLAPEAAERTLLDAQRSDGRARPPDGASPAARFLARQHRRTATEAATRALTPPFGCVRWPDGATVSAGPVPSTAADPGATAPMTPETLERELRKLRRWRRRTREASAAAAVRLGLALAERLVRARLAEDLAAWRTLLAESLAGLEGPLRLMVHPADVERVTALLGEAPRPVGADGIDVQADACLAPGDLVLEARVGRRDARVTTRLAALLAGAAP